MEIRFDYLERLADHLQYGELGHDEFDLGCYDSRTNVKENRCGTAGCAMGELHLPVPEFIDFLKQEGYQLEDHDNPASASGSLDHMRFLGLSTEQYSHLFVFCSQEPEIYGGTVYKNPTPLDVAFNIRAFIRIMKKED